jgi:hypothetical protein
LGLAGCQRRGLQQVALALAGAAAQLDDPLEGSIRADQRLVQPPSQVGVVEVEAQQPLALVNIVNASGIRDRHGACALRAWMRWRQPSTAALVRALGTTPAGSLRTAICARAPLL